MRRLLCWAFLSVFAAAMLALRGDAPPGSAMAASVRYLEQAAILMLVLAGALVDVHRRIIPDGVSLGIVVAHALALAGASLAAYPAATMREGAFLQLAYPFATGLASALALGGGLLAFTLAYEHVRGPGAFGGGDVKLLAALGFALGLGRALILLFVACGVFACYAAAIAFLLRIAGQARVDALPFCPAIAAACYLVLLAG